MALTQREHQQLLTLARRAIDTKLQGQECIVDRDEYSPQLQELGACFVTLHHRNRLRGCIGSLIPSRSLLDEVVANAQSAAFDDPRFAPLSPAEFAEVTIDISVLSPQEEIVCASEAELLAALEPQRDGLVLQEGYSRATFLPSVWEQLPDRREFVHQLKRKAGLTPNYWSDTIRFSRYYTECFSE